MRFRQSSRAPPPPPMFDPRACHDFLVAFVADVGAVRLLRMLPIHPAAVPAANGMPALRRALARFYASETAGENREYLRCIRVLCNAQGVAPHDAEPAVLAHTLFGRDPTLRQQACERYTRLMCSRLPPPFTAPSSSACM